MKDSLDPAFLRRLRFVVQFPFPDAQQRADIWSRVFPEKTEVAKLNLERLAKLTLAGGNIRNVALSAAFLAANSGEKVGMKHLAAAARAEYRKLEKPMSEIEVGAWS
jgi:ATP-dependent 26S proteasome regulatory subunit